MATDPVRFAIVDEDTAKFKTSYRDKGYYFCRSVLQTRAGPGKLMN